MTGNDRRENTPTVKPELDDGPLIPMSPAQSDNDSGPLFEPNRWYSQSSIIERLGIGKHTFARWIAAGLQTHQPGTRQALVFTDEKFDEILKTPVDRLPPPYVSPHAAKNKARKSQKKG